MCVTILNYNSYHFSWWKVEMPVFVHKKHVAVPGRNQQLKLKVGKTGIQTNVSAFLACRLIALDKCPGVRPIGVCETSRRIISKAIFYAIKDDIQDVAGSLQLCAGQIAGIEAAIHFMRESFHDESTEAVLLVDASNAFNSVNREAALHNIRHVCPALATVLINTYREATELFVGGSTLFRRKA